MTTVRESIQTASNRIQSATSTIAPERGSAGAEDQLFPHDSLVRNLHRFMRFSSAAYGVSPPLAFSAPWVCSDRLTKMISKTSFGYLAWETPNTTFPLLGSIMPIAGHL